LVYAIVIAAAVLLVAVFHFVGGWIWSSGFHERALVPKPPTRTWGVSVESVSARTVVLTATEPRQNIGHPGTLGMYWEGGYARVGEVSAVEGLLIRRSLHMVEGDVPAPGTKVDLESYAFPNDPSDVDLAFRETAYASELGPIAAWVAPGKGARRWVVHVHGWTAAKREAIRLLPGIHASGMTSMVIDYRNDPGAPADPSGMYRFGLTEWRDVEAATQHALESGADDVVLAGYSTGAAHIMSFMERSDLAERVVGLVFDSPNIILADTVRHGTRGLRLEPTPIPVSRLMSEFGMWITDLRWKIDWETTNYVERAETILTCPTLVFHGTSDHRVPISESRQLEARSGMVTLVETPAAGHVMSWNADPDRYERYLTGFLASL